jgi:hypothetical protein
VPQTRGVRLPEAEIERLLATWPVARLATVAPDGRPHLVPIVFARHAGALWSPIDGKPKTGSAGAAGPGAGGAAGGVARRTPRLARVANVAAEPRVSVLLDHYDDDWRRLWWIRVDGRAALVAGDPGAEAALRAKYPQYRETPLYAGAPALLRIEPERCTSWAASDPADAGGRGELPSREP